MLRAESARIHSVTWRRCALWQAGRVRYMPAAERWRIVFRGTAVECLN